VGICSNSVRGFLAGIWASVLAGSSEDALICGNSVFGADAGIVLGDGYAMVSSNLVMQSASAGIDGSFQDSLCIVGNLVKSSSSANGIEVNGCAKTLVVGNIAQVAGGGTSFLLTDPQPPNGLVMSGNLGVGGVVPLDGAGSPWPTGWHIAADCRWMPHP
jgi:hypothetical protein